MNKPNLKIVRNSQEQVWKYLIRLCYLEQNMRIFFQVKMKRLKAKGVHQIALHLILFLFTKNIYKLANPECLNQEFFSSGPEDGRHGFIWGPNGKTI